MAKGQRVSAETIDEGLLPGPAAPEFRYIHHEDSWEHVTIAADTGDRTIVVPRLREFYFVPGAQGVKLAGKRPDPRAALIDLQMRGNKVVPVGAPVFTTEGGKLVKSKGYLHTFKHTDGSLSYAPVWTSPIVAGKGVDWATLWDHDAYLATILLWLDEGFLHKPTAAAVAAHTRIMRDRLNRNISRAISANPNIQAQYAADVDAYEKLTAFQNELTVTARKGARVAAD